MSTQIHWHEGLFLQPHHLQRMQRGMLEQGQAGHRLAWHYPYGLIEAQLSHDELENMRVCFDKLRAVMPSGLEICLPGNTELAALDIKAGLAKTADSFTVYLGVPLWFDNRANTLQPGPNTDARAKMVFRVKERECLDENTGENPQPIPMRWINARLLLEHDDRSDMEVLPLLRIKRATGEDVGLPKQDMEYVPPCLVLEGSPLLRELVRDLVAQVEASRKELVMQIARGGTSLDAMRGAQFELLMRLRTLNRFSAILPSWIQAPRVAPFQMYLSLRELLAELAALYPDKDPFDCAAYDHDNPYPAFHELSVKIRGFLRGAVAPSYIKVAFKETDGLLLAALTEDHFTKPNAYFLGVKSKADPNALTRYVENADQFKLMPKSLSRAAIFGVLLKEERFPPMELPAQADMHYFRVLVSESARRWQQIKDEKAAAIDCQHAELDLAHAEFAFYMTVPNPSLAP
jgi:type VI secretion system ImpJ/VasE family protein